MAHTNRITLASILVIAMVTSASVGVLAGATVTNWMVRDTFVARPVPQAAPPAALADGESLLHVNMQTAATDAVARVGPAVVTVVDHLSESGPAGPDPTASGSGVIISPDGYIITNNHVVRGNKSLEVILRDGNRVSAALVGTDAFADLAVIKVSSPVPAVVALANCDMLKPGETAIAVGSPLGDLQNTVTVRRASLAPPAAHWTRMTVIRWKI